MCPDASVLVMAMEPRSPNPVGTSAMQSASLVSESGGKSSAALHATPPCQV